MRTGEGKGSVRVDVLGPLRLVVDEAAVQVRGPKRRAVLALLAVAEGRVVSVDHLLDALWPSELPASARATLHSHVSRLRGHLGSAHARLESVEGGYRLVLGDAESDVSRARSLLAQGRDRAPRNPTGACAPLRAALALWRGPVLADLAEVLPLAMAAAALEQLRREITDDLIACAIRAGRTDPGQLVGVVALADEALATDPLREPAVLLLMHALAVTGRTAEALRTGRAYRRRLAEEAGLDPSPALDDLEHGIAGGAVGADRTIAAASSDAASTRFGLTVARPVTRLIGREAQVAMVQRLLVTERLVTLVGPGGVGKTRVALEVAWRAESAAVLGLASVTDPAAIPHTLAAALDLQVVRGNVLAACVAVLAAGPALLVIDNCEHVLGAVRDLVARVMTDCPALTVLATSRESLGLAAECRSPLAPLAVPRPEQLDARDGTLQRVPAVVVFLDRAARVRAGFSPGPDELHLIGELVRKLDGMPLAIELAAGRLSLFSLVDLHARLDRALDLLGSGRPSADARHRTLRATVDWSYRLLPANEQRLFRHLSVFVDGVDLGTAEEVAVDLGVARDGDPVSALAHLVDASMIDVSFDGGTRYRMLETLRAFGVDRLAAAGDTGQARDRLLRWAVRLTGWIEATLTTDREPDADAAVRRELPNLRAAWHLARQQGSVDDAAAMVIALRAAFGWRDLTEIRGWADELVDDPALAGHPRAAAVLGTAATAAYHRGDLARADRLARAGLDIAVDADGTWRCLFALSLTDLGRAALDASLEHSLAAAAVANKPAENLAVAALAATYAGDLEHASSLSDQVTALASSPTLRAFAAYTTAEIDTAAGHPELAAERYARAIDLARLSGATFLAGIATVGLVTALIERGQVTEALRGYRDVIDYFARTGNWTHLRTTLRNLANLLRTLGDHEPAALLDTTVATDTPPTATREHILQVARQAIAHNQATALGREEQK